MCLGAWVYRCPAIRARTRFGVRAKHNGLRGFSFFRDGADGSLALPARMIGLVFTSVLLGIGFAQLRRRGTFDHMPRYGHAM